MADQNQSVEVGKVYDPIEVQPAILRDIDRFDLSTCEYEQLVQMGIEAGEVKSYTNWVLGKLGDAVATKYGDLTKYAKEIRMKPPVLSQYMYVYRKFTSEDPDFTPDKYYGSVPWGVLQLVASKSDKPQEMINELHDSGHAGSIESASRKIKENETGKTVPSKPKVSVVWDDYIEKYRVVLPPPSEWDKLDFGDQTEALIAFLTKPKLETANIPQ